MRLNGNWSRSCVSLVVLLAVMAGVEARGNQMFDPAERAISVLDAVGGGDSWLGDEDDKKEREQARREAEEDAYDSGTDALDERQWDDAIEAFAEVARMKGRRADGALYWQSFALNKQGRRDDALATLTILKKGYPSSRWLAEANALELEIRHSVGQSMSPEGQSDEELKLLAINSLLQSDSSRAVPMLSKFLKSSKSPKLKERALFVLAQCACPDARGILADIARGRANPDLQMTAVKYLGLFGGAESKKILAEVYESTGEVDVKRAILRSYMTAGEHTRLLTAAKGEANPELRQEAIRQLGILGAKEALRELYQTEQSKEIRAQIIQAFFISGSYDRLLELAKGEKDPDLRRKAIRSVGLLGSQKAGDALVSIYATENVRYVRDAVIDALFVQGNARALIQIARQEKDPELKKEAVRRLSLMNSKDATDFLMELLND